MEPSLEILVDFARGAGEILRAGYGKQHNIVQKGRIDLVTEVDHRSEAYLMEQIRERFPGHTIEAEESGLQAGTAREHWYIDPLDGTTNYAHHIPIFCVSLGFAIAGKVQLGVVYDPLRDECFSAQRGKGAWLNGSPISVSETGIFTQSLLSTGFPYEVGPDGRDNLEHFTHFTRLTQGVRRMGSAALDLCYVAAGRLEGYWELTLKPWDLAAGALIVEEAGGRVTRVDGLADYLTPPFSILAGNPTIYARMQEEMHKLALA